MAEAEIVVGHCEVAGREGLVVGFALAGDVARAPAAVDQFPLPVVDLDCVPGVVAALWRHALAWPQSCMPIPFPMSANHDTFHARFGRQRCEEPSIALADCETGLEHRGGRGGFDSVVEEGDGVVRDIVVEPGEDRAGFICGRGEGGCQLRCETVEGGNGLAGEFGGVGVWRGEVAADETGGDGGRGGGD